MSDEATHNPLKPPHAPCELLLPEEDPERRMFFLQCCESADFHRCTSERQQVHLVKLWSLHHFTRPLSMQEIHARAVHRHRHPSRRRRGRSVLHDQPRHDGLLPQVRRLLPRHRRHLGIPKIGPIFILGRGVRRRQGLLAELPAARGHRRRQLRGDLRACFLPSVFIDCR